MPAADDTGALTLVGDSLNVGTDPWLREELPRWDIDAHDRVGRTTAEGIEVLRERGAALAPVVVVSLGTNDPDGTEAGVPRARRARRWRSSGPTGASCGRPSLAVEERSGFNDVLRDAALGSRERPARRVGLASSQRAPSSSSSIWCTEPLTGTRAGLPRRRRIVRTCPDGGGA